MADKVDRALAILAVVFGLIALLVAWDFLSALNAQACGSTGASTDCYPWGAEGPSAADWKYSSKTTYLVSGGTFLIAVAAALLTVAPAFRSGVSLSRWRRVVGAIVILLAAGILWS